MYKCLFLVRMFFSFILICILLFHLALWKQACDHIMDVPLLSPSKRKKSFLRKSSIYDDTPISGRN